MGGRVLGRPNFWEAVGGRGRPCSLIGSLIWSDLCYPIRGARPPTASHFRTLKHTASHGLPEIRPPKHTASHILSCDLSEPIREHSLPRKSDLRGRSDSTGRSNAFSREISQTRPRITLPCPESDRPPIGLSLRPLTTKSYDLSVRVRGGRPWESMVGGRGRPIGLSDRSHDCGERPKWGSDWSASQGQPWESDPRASRTSPSQSRWFHSKRCDWPEDRTLTAGPGRPINWTLTSIWCCQGRGHATKVNQLEPIRKARTVAPRTHETLPNLLHLLKIVLLESTTLSG